MTRQKPRSDADLEYRIGVVRNDPPAARVGRRYSRDEIRVLEETLVPWLRERRIWAERRARSS